MTRPALRRLPAPEALAARPFVRALPGVLRQAAPFGVAVALALVVRHAVIEPAPIAHACDPDPWAGACAMRTLVLLAFVRQGIGWVALGAGLMSMVVRRRGLAQAALVAGGAGLVLYSFTLSAIGALLGLLVLAREPRGPMQASANSASPPRKTSA